MVTIDFSKLQHDLSDGQIIDAFQDFCSAQGLIFNGSDSNLIPDGKVHYVKVIGRSNKNKNNKSGWYILNLSGDIAKGRCGWYHGDNPSFSWHLYYDYIKPNRSSGKVKLKRVDELEMLRREEQRTEAEIVAQLEEALNAICSKVYSAFEFFRSIETDDHPYLTEKGIEPSFVRTLNPNRYDRSEVERFIKEYYPQHFKVEVVDLIMALQNDDNKKVFYSRDKIIIIKGIDFDFNYKTFQYILPQKTKDGKQKLFLGIPKSKQGSFSLIYDYDLPEPDRNARLRFIICEGWATGVALYKLTKGSIPIIVAWDAGNLPHVARGLRNAYYSAQIYICGDNDHASFNKVKNEYVNAGLIAAKRAATQVKSVIALPPFNSSDVAQKELSDWDDYLAFYGFDKAQDELRKAMKLDAVNATYKLIDYEYEHPPVLWSERLVEFKRTSFPVSTCGFTRYITGLSNAVKLGLNDLLDDQALDGTLRFNMEQQHHYDFSVEMRVENLARNNLHRYITKALGVLENDLIKQSDLQSLIPQIAEIFELGKCVSMQVAESVRDLVVEHALAYNSQVWIDSLYGPIFENIDKALIPAKIISELKNQDIFYSHPIYNRDLQQEPKSPTEFTEYWLWYLNLSLGMNVPNQLTMLTTVDFQVSFENFKENHKTAISKLAQKEVNPEFAKLHKTIDSSLSLMINDLIIAIQTNDINDIRYYEDAVHAGFNAFEKFPLILELYKNEVVNVFSRFESKEWSKCVVDNMWTNYLNACEA